MNILNSRKGELLLLLASVIWGSSYIFQKMGMDYVGPFTFGFFRFCIGALALVPVIILFDWRARRIGPDASGNITALDAKTESAADASAVNESTAIGSFSAADPSDACETVNPVGTIDPSDACETVNPVGTIGASPNSDVSLAPVSSSNAPADEPASAYDGRTDLSVERSGFFGAFTDRSLLIGSLLCGLTQFGAGSLQQIGLIYTTAGKAGFITSMHIVIVPIMMLFLRRKVSLPTWIGVALAVFGMYLLCITDGFSISLGDGLVFCCAVIYALQLLLIDYYAVRVDPIRLAALQFLIAGILSGAFMLGLEEVQLAAIIACAIPILYTGLLEVAAAYTLEIFGQQTTSPAIAAIILSLESVFAVLCGAIVLGEQMTGRESLGCVIMMAAFLFTQFADLIRARKRQM